MGTLSVTPRTLFVCALILLNSATAFSQGTIVTVAGTDWLFPPQTMPALNAPLGPIEGIALDSAGNTYLADPANQMVFKVSPSGQLQIFAGNGIAGFSVSGSPATSYSLQNPDSLAIDSSGNLYVGEFGWIHKITPDGVMTLVAGGGSAAPKDGVPATSVALGPPRGLMLDSQGDLYFAADFVSQIYKVTPDGIIHIVAGTGQPGYSGDGGPATLATFRQPSGIAVDSSGNLYISDASALSPVIRKIDSSGNVTTIAGNGADGETGDGGLATSASLNMPHDIAIDATGNIYVLEEGAIRKITPGGIINTIPTIPGGLIGPHQFVLRGDGSFLVANTDKSQAVSLSSSGLLTPVAGNGKFRNTPAGAPAVTAWLQTPWSVALDSAGSLYFSDGDSTYGDFYPDNGAIRKITGGIFSTPYANDTSFSTHPYQIAFDPANNLYVAMSAFIIKAAPGGTPGIFAGGGSSSADGVKATAAQFLEVRGVAVGADGSIYAADYENFLVRKISPSGLVTTIAGNGRNGYLGDNGPATSAELSVLGGLVVDSAGDVYVSDIGNARVRKITPQGIITTVAGCGGFCPLGDGGPGTSANLNQPEGLALDAAGNLYIAESAGNRVRVLTPGGMISTFAGTGTAGFAGDGGPAVNALLNTPRGVAVDPFGNVYVSDSGNNRIREVLAAPAVLSVSPGSLTASAVAGGSLTTAASITVSASTPGLSYTVATNVPWLNVTPSSGSLPAALVVTADPSQLSAGSYPASITIVASNAAASAQTVSFTLNVAPGVAPSLSLDSTPLSFAFSFNSGGQSSQQVRVINTGSGPAQFTAAASTSAGGNWLAVSPLSGSTSAAAPATLTITATPGSLNAGTYTGTVTITGTGDSGAFTIPVSMTINSSQQILLSQSGLTFRGVSQGGAVLPQSIGILNGGAGSGAMKWTAAANMLSGSGWLSISPSSGTVDNPLLDVSSVSVSVNAKSLTPGNYFGSIVFTAPGAANSPQSVVIVLNVLPTGSNPGPEVRPTGLIFTGSPGQNLSSQSVMVSDTAGTSQLIYGSGATYVSGANWVRYLPANAQLDPANPTRIVVQPDFTALAPNVYRGAITLAFSDGSIANVALLSVVAPPATSTPPSERASGKFPRPRSGACQQSSIVLQTTSPQQAFSAAVGQPSAIEVQLVDSCGNPVTGQGGSASVLATFSNGDPSVKFIHIQNGQWSGTWQPRNGSPGSNVSVTISALSVAGPSGLLGAQSVMTATLSSGAPAPLTRSVQNAASLANTGAVAPGALVSVFGSGLTSGTSVAQGAPLPVDMLGTEVTLGGVSLPLLYAGDGQVNAQVPYNLVLNTQLQLQVKQGSTLSVPQSLTVAPAQPAVFTVSQNGSGQGAIVNLANVVVDQNAPASAGDAIVIYCTGLGPVSPAVPSGAAAPLSPLSYTNSTVTATVGGLPANVIFAGLAPTFAGLYQVNAIVPAGVTPGDAVPVVLQVAGQTSPPVTIAVK